MHPLGSEVVICTTGSMTLLQQQSDGSIVETVLQPGDYAINASGVWHSANIADRAEAIFITAGKETEHRPR